jgi:hypothetical protein
MLFNTFYIRKKASKKGIHRPQILEVVDIAIILKLSYIR